MGVVLALLGCFSLALGGYSLTTGKAVLVFGRVGSHEVNVALHGWSRVIIGLSALLMAAAQSSDSSLLMASGGLGVLAGALVELWAVRPASPFSGG
ncbi:hypothetical protein ACIBG8_26680 [Nonomuraea sp. NPDC050556]|uniref:hypothetical protein n=1 Tax=Nonomuraea sp. NPDC050556 TaxID=3364369 RepID=UPI0037875584